jgi:hypothetical protein
VAAVQDNEKSASTTGTRQKDDCRNGLIIEIFNEVGALDKV